MTASRCAAARSTRACHSSALHSSRLMHETWNCTLISLFLSRGSYGGDTEKYHAASARWLGTSRPWTERIAHLAGPDAPRNLNPAYDRFGSKASLATGPKQRRMSGSAPLADVMMRDGGTRRSAIAGLLHL